MDNFNDNQNQWAENIDAIENTEKSENTDTEIAKPTIPQAPQNIVTQPVDAVESTPVNETTPYREYVMKTQPEIPTYSVNTTTPKAQSNKMSAGLKAFMIITLSFIGALLVAFIAYISVTTPLNNKNISKEYFYTTPEVTVPTEVPNENQSQGSFDPESQTDKDFKGLKLEQKPNKDKDKYGANYTFKALDNAVVVKSSSLGLMQHDAFTWLFAGGKFVTQQDITIRSHKIDSTVKNFLKLLERNERETLVEVLYKILKATEEENVWLMPEAAAKRFPEIKKAIEDLSEEEKKTLTSIILTLEKARRETRRRNINGWK